MRATSYPDGVFEAELAKGQACEDYVAGVLRAEGIDVVQPPRLAEYDPNEQDLLIGHRVVEVKSTSRPFTGPTDFPFDPAMVTTTYNWSNKYPKPCAVILVSQVTHALAVIPVSSEPQWVRMTRYDSVRRQDRETWGCPRRLLRTFGEFVDWLRR